MTVRPIWKAVIKMGLAQYSREQGGMIIFPLRMLGAKGPLGEPQLEMATNARMSMVVDTRGEKSETLYKNQVSPKEKGVFERG